MKTKLFMASLLTLTGFYTAKAQWTTSGSDIYNSNAGNVGIGTSVPATKLHIATTGAHQFLVERTSGQINGLKMYFTSNPASGIAIGSGATIFQNQASSGADMFFMPSPTAGAAIIKANGNVGIGTIAPGYKLHVESDDANMVNNPMQTSSTVLEPSFTTSYSKLSVASKYGVHTAIYGYNLNNTTASNGYAITGIGVFGKTDRTSGGSSNVFNIGVYGRAVNSIAYSIGGVFYGNSSATIGDKSSGPERGRSKAFGLWADGSEAAGYFNGISCANSFFQEADEKLKSNVVPLTDALAKLKLLKPTTFDFNTDEFGSLNLPEGKQMGLNPTDLERVFPELVEEISDLSLFVKNQTTDIAVYKTINYTNLIPLLIAGAQEQQQQIEEQKKANEELRNLVALQQQQINDLISGKGTTGVGYNSAGNDGFSMDQNVPNPFSKETVVKYHMPAQVSKASMIIYDLSGKQMKSIPLTQRGDASVSITADELAAGMYIYSVVADGKILDSKRMVVTAGE